MPQLGSKKSRLGCKRCKQRRVKCDEKIPCGSCVRRNEECSFLVPSPGDSSDTIKDVDLSPDTENWILDLELMHHYTTVLHQIGARERLIHLWKYYIPEQAFQHPFLMHGLLAFSALHLAYLRPKSSSKYLQLCDNHQSIALQKFRSILSSPVDPELTDALLPLAATLSLSSMARSCALSESATMDMDAIAELFILTKGIANVIRLSREHIQQGPMSEFLVVRTYPKDGSFQLPVSISSRLEAIRGMVASYGLDPEAQEHCQSAVAELEETYKQVAYFSRTSKIETSDVSRWQVFIPMGFVRLIKAHVPPALVILAYYAAAITAIHSAWYTENWAAYALRGIGEALGDNLEEWLQWPKQQVHDRMSELSHPSSHQEGSVHHPIAQAFDQMAV